MTEDGWGIFGIVMAVIIVLGSVYYASQNANWAGIGGALGTLFFAITNFIPFGLITFGLIADLIGQEFRYSIGSAVGFFAILFNFIIAKFAGWSDDTYSGTESTDVMGWCMIPGLEKLESKVFPMNIVSSSAIIAYYLGFAATVRQPRQNISIGVAFPLLFIIQLGTFFGGGCDKYYIGGFGSKVGAFILGTILGLSSFGVVSSSFPAYAPFLNPQMGGATQSNYGNSSRPPMAPGVGGAPPTGAKCSQDNSEDGDEFVCEAYKNGVLVTEEISK